MAGQSTGRIGGTVSDGTSAALEGAQVVLRNSGTGQELQTITNASGAYQFSSLVYGDFELSVSRDGFQAVTRSGVRLLTGQTLAIDVTLQISGVAQSVEITGELPVVTTTSSSVRTAVTTKQIQELPLNGRNPLQLVTLSAGAQLTDSGTVSGQQDNRGLTVNGLLASQNNYRLDGSNYNNRFFGSAPTFPNPDTLGEFTVQSSGYSAVESGAGAVIELATRSGTNSFHGSLYHFLRNTKLNARNFFDVSRPPFKLNQYGGTIGGPVVKNKTFFFYSYQGTKQRSSPSPIQITPPTAAQRAGNFSGTATPIRDPLNGESFPGNIIPPNRLNAVSQRLMDALLPLPNRGVQFIGFANRNIDDEQHLGRFDHAFSDKNRLSVRYFFDQNDFERPFNAPPGFFAANSFRNQSLTIRDTHIFSPGLTFSGAASFSRFARTQVPQSPGLQTTNDFGAVAPLGTTADLYPGIRVMVNPFFQLFSGGALQQIPTTFDYRGAFTAIWRNHVFQFGADLERSRAYTLDLSFTPVTYNFNGSRTGSAVADFLLGLPNQTVQDSGRTNDLRQYRPQFYIQDDWKVNSHLTLNLGLRYEPWLPPVDLKNNLVGFVPGVQSSIAPNAPAGLLYPGDNGIGDSVFRKDWNNFAPRVGFAYTPGSDARTVIRGAYGLFYTEPAYTIYTRTVSTQPNVLTVTNNNPGPFEDVYRGASPFPRDRVQPSQFGSFQFTRPVSGGVLDPAARTGYSQSWNFTLEREVVSGLAVSTAYVGNLGVKILAATQLNPAVFASGATTANTDARRLYSGLGAVEIASPYQSSNYHALQTTVTQRFKAGLTLLANYTWSKAIDNNSSALEGSQPANPFNLRANRGASDFDTRHRAAISFVYQLPEWKGLSRGWKLLANGWQLNGIAVLQTGSPFNVLSGTDRSLSGVNGDRADLVGDWRRPEGRSQVDAYFNPAAFLPAAAGTFGSLGRNALYGPGRSNIDLAAFRNVAVTERVQLQIRAEGFNIQNRANFNNPNATVTAGANFGRILSANDPRVFQFGTKIIF